MESLGHGGGSGSLHMPKTGDRHSVSSDASPTPSSSTFAPSCSDDSDPLAYNKAILIGDFCTAQQLSRAGGAASSTSNLQRPTNADYNDLAYLHARSIDPSALPNPVGAGVRTGGDNWASRSMLGTSGVKLPLQVSRPPSTSSSVGDFRRQTESPANPQQQLREHRLFRGTYSLCAFSVLNTLPMLIG